MFKVFVFIKRKDGMSVSDFRKYYETSHAPLGAKLVPNFKKYVRHYVSPYTVGETGGSIDLPCDVVTEIWFDDKEDFDRGMAFITDPENSRLIIEDEEKVFDRSSICFSIVEDRETELHHRHTSE